MKTMTLVSLSYWQQVLATGNSELIKLAKEKTLIVYDEQRNYFVPVQGMDGTWHMQLSED